MRITNVSDGGIRTMANDPSINIKKSRRKTEDTEIDPINLLGIDLMLQVFSYLDASSLGSTLLVSRSWFNVTSLDILWSPLCEQLWIGKAHIPRRCKLPGLSKLASYSEAVNDSKRVHITRKDLWEHVWNFHFTEVCQIPPVVVKSVSKSVVYLAGITIIEKCDQAAPTYWKNLDPYWRGEGPLMRRYFNPDGTVSSDPHDEVWGGHECSYTVVTSVLLANGKIKENYVRVNRWPPLRVSRRDDWGWEMSNVIFAYSSIPDADKKDETEQTF